MIKNDAWIREQARAHKLIEPFAATQVREGVVSYGVSSYGYDFRLASDYKIPHAEQTGVIDPKHFDRVRMTDYSGAECIIPPKSYLLARTLEFFRIPRRIMALCFGKSTYARCGIVLNVTPLEPEWEGYITICIGNLSSLPVKIYSGEGIGQVLFFESNRDPDISYKDKKGKYQDQQNITGAKI